MTEPDESQNGIDCYCKLQATTHRIAPEQLRKSLSDHRNKLKDVRWNLLAQVKTLEREIATCDAMLADLIME